MTELALKGLEIFKRGKINTQKQCFPKTLKPTF